MVSVSACVRIRVRVSVRIRVRLWIRISFRHYVIASRSSTVSILSSHDPISSPEPAIPLYCVGETQYRGIAGSGDEIGHDHVRCHSPQLSGALSMFELELLIPCLNSVSCRLHLSC